MPDKKIKRRDFLKLTVATTAAQGLSHFRFLNFEGIKAVSAHGNEPSYHLQGCDPPGAPPDECMGADICEPPGTPPDACFDGDICVPPGTPPDNCNPIDPADICPDPAIDHCIMQLAPDTCGSVNDPDVCVPGAEPDECLPPGDPDECIPPETPEDICDPAIGEPDTNAVTMSGVEAKGSILTVLGGVAALVTGAALWIKSRLPVVKSDKD